MPKAAKKVSKEARKIKPLPSQPDYCQKNRRDYKYPDKHHSYFIAKRKHSGYGEPILIN